MVLDPQYTYLIGCLSFIFLWLVLFILRKDLRREMITMSFLIAPLGPLSEFFYLRDYWKPDLINGYLIGIEDFLFAFAIGGITAVLYEIVFSRRYKKRGTTTHLGVMLLLSLSGLLFMVVGSLILGFNSIYTSTTGFLLLGTLIVIFRHDLLADAFWSGILVGTLMLGFYIIFISLFPGIIQKWWMLENLSGILILGAPLEELMWGFGWGFFAGPAYEFVKGLRLIGKSSSNIVHHRQGGAS